ncbi:polysaccharide biosynthesis protein [Robinsoniella peoriensis]|uniref:polysaccharide biosynthesis protein n=1 Tax=Robinsoniella peoriensis TaxID=180332 RepID=UPI00085C3377|nr:nucleoside-diphosphate sugar epimerase/dehydratase [Robinsoniella peoriensis]
MKKKSNEQTDNDSKKISLKGGNSLKKKHLEHWKVIAFYLFLYDVIAMNFSYFFGLWLRFDLRFSNIPKEYWLSFLKFAPFYTIFSVIVFYFLRLYNSLWRFASFSELNRICAATIITSLFQTICITAFVKRMPVSYYLIGAMIQFLMVVVIRFAYRYITLERVKRERNGKAMYNAMIIGAGSAGRVILKELNSSDESEMKSCCVIDDNPNKWGRLIEGTLIVGGRDSIMEAVERYKIDKILFAISSASAEARRDILNICKETKCELRSLPGVYQLVNGEVSLSKMKAVAVEDLLGREPIKVNMDEIFQYIKDKTILVTGGGGSIGSELCRQIAGHEPKQLVIFDIYENNAYDIEQELKRKYPKLNLSVLIGSVRDSRRINWIFETYKPDIVYHAAAHKHVPLMETSPNEAIKNNVVGTYKTAYAALRNGTQKFVLISTDKAVNPTNIMGASKRLCEMVIQSMDIISREGKMDLLPILNSHMSSKIDGQRVRNSGDHIIEKGNTKIENFQSRGRHGTQFVAVRFGNVLGSNGSVIPLFKKQIEEGGPVTVTHPDIIRYFMTIPEAVSLVMQAGIYAKGGEIFVLDMGAPVKIDTLARNLIKLSGYIPDKDIKIEYSGLRSGEKLFEEKLMAEEGMEKTNNELIHIGKPIPFDTKKFLKKLVELTDASFENNDHIVQMVEEIVSTFHPVGAEPTGEENINSKVLEAQRIAMSEVAATQIRYKNKQIAK